MYEYIFFISKIKKNGKIEYVYIMLLIWLLEIVDHQGKETAPAPQSNLNILPSVQEVVTHFI